MKHGVRFWDKKLNRTPSHRRALLRNLLTQLVYHEQIQTTLPKAKFMQRAADKLIELAKSGRPEDLKKAESLLFVPNITLSKLRGPLTARYATRKGGYTRIHMNGFRGIASDRAPMAIVELVDNPKDIIHALAQQHAPTVQSRLEELESRLYRREVIPVRDPITGEPGQVVRLHDRHNLSGREKLKLTRQELGLTKTLQKMQKALATWPAARTAEIEHAQSARERRSKQYQALIEEMQRKVDEELTKGDGELGAAFSTLLQRKRLVITEDGRVERVPSAAELAYEGKGVEGKIEESQLASPLEDVTTIVTPETVQDVASRYEVLGQAPREGEASTLGRLFGKLGLGSKK